MGAIKKSISMPEDLWQRMEQRLLLLGYSNPSAYLQQLVRDDIIRQGAHVRGLEHSLMHDAPPTTAEQQAENDKAAAATVISSYSKSKKVSKP